MKKSFSEYIELAFDLSAILELPGVKEQHAALIREMWEHYPDECESIGLTNGLKETV